MPKPYAHDHSPPAGERNSRVRPPRAGGRGLTRPDCGGAIACSSRDAGPLCKATVPADNPDRPMRRDVPGRRPHDTHLLAQDTSRKDK